MKSLSNYRYFHDRGFLLKINQIYRKFRTLSMANIRNRRMDDPEGVTSRVFVGNLPIDADRETLKKKFESHGQVNGVMVLKGFAFVQFEKEQSAKLAIEKENGSDFCGKKIDVKQAKQNNSNSGGGGGGYQQNNSNNSGGGGGYQQNNSNNSGGGGGYQQHINYNQHQQNNNPSSYSSRGGGGGYNNRGGPGGYNYRGGPGGGGGYNSRGGGRGGGGYNNRGGPGTFGRGNFAGGFNNRGGQGGDGGVDRGWGRGYARGGGGGFGGGYQGPGHGEDDQYNESDYNDYDERSEMERYNDRLQSDQNTSDGGERQGGSWPHSQPPTSEEKPNDVEIICMDKSIRMYGENIESRLKNMGLSVDILFPNPEISLGSVIGNIASRGVMYAICLQMDNKDLGSLTLNVLQGEQQEHRNMPVDDAMTFISKNFSNHFTGSGSSNGSGLNKTVTSSSGHPPDIEKILSFLIDDRALSMMEYDKMIKYLVSKRTALLREEYGDSIPVHLQQPPVGPPQDPATKAKQEELQQRIQKILKQKQSSASTVTSNMDPSLQAAIDSLVKNGPNLLSNVPQQKPFSAVGGGFSSNSQFQSSSFSQQYSRSNQSSGQGGFTGGFGDY